MRQVTNSGLKEDNVFELLVIQYFPKVVAVFRARLYKFSILIHYSLVIICERWDPGRVEVV